MMKSAKVATKTSKAAIKTTKTAIKTSKVAIKTTATAAKATMKSAAASAKAAKIAILAIKKAILITKITIKATIVAVKATIATIKGLVAAIAAGGWIVILIIVIIAVLIAVIYAMFGFFAGRDDDYSMNMQQIMSQVSTEFYSQIDEIQENNPADILELAPMSLNWREILPVFSVLTSEQMLDDNARIIILSQVVDDMARFEYYTTSEYVLDEYYELIEMIALRINLVQISAFEVAELYGFDFNQLWLLLDLLSPEFDEVWAYFLGGFNPENGQVLQGSTNFIPLGIFAWPTVGNYPISSPFGWRTHPITYERSFHGGIDIAAPFNAPILAMADGVVVAANSIDRWGGGWGFFVKIQHDDGYVTFYAHCSSIAVNVGQEVVQGEVIGFVGSTGQSTGDHLHFEVFRNGARVNPMEYFRVD